MNTNHIRKLFATLLCGSLLAAGGAAQAGDRWDDHGRGWDNHKHHYKHHHHRHFRDYDDRRTVIRERVIVREYPRYYAPPVVEHRYYDAPVRSYGYSRSPAVVVGVDIPPLVIPLR
ncbi:MAG: hypothetical protein J0M28_17560 [Thauera sp.]|nr:hypothetical protein [Thauera sp.]